MSINPANNNIVLFRDNEPQFFLVGSFLSGDYQSSARLAATCKKANAIVKIKVSLTEFEQLPRLRALGAKTIKRKYPFLHMLEVSFYRTPFRRYQREEATLLEHGMRATCNSPTSFSKALAVFTRVKFHTPLLYAKPLYFMLQAFPNLTTLDLSDCDLTCYHDPDNDNEMLRLNPSHSLKGFVHALVSAKKLECLNLHGLHISDADWFLPRLLPGRLLNNDDLGLFNRNGLFERLTSIDLSGQLLLSDTQIGLVSTRVELNKATKLPEQQLASKNS